MDTVPCREISVIEAQGRSIQNLFLFGSDTYRASLTNRDMLAALGVTCSAFSSNPVSRRHMIEHLGSSIIFKTSESGRVVSGGIQEPSLGAEAGSSVLENGWRWSQMTNVDHRSRLPQ